MPRLDPVSTDQIPVRIVRLEANCLDEVSIDDEELALVGQQIPTVLFADNPRLSIRSTPDVPMDLSSLRIEQGSEVDGIRATQNRNGVRPTLETQLSRNDRQAVPAPDGRTQRCRIAVPEFVQPPSAGYCLGFVPTDLSVKPTRVNLQIGNHTSHRILRLSGQVPLLRPTKLASAKVFALGVQGVETFGGSGAPAH